MGPMGKALGMGKKPMMGADEEEGEDYASPDEEAPEEEAEGDVPPDFQSAYDDYEQDPSAKTMYAMIQACEGMDEKKAPGLEVILGGKAKK